MIDVAQFRRSTEYGEFIVGQERDVELQALGFLAGVIAGRDLSSDSLEIHLRFYDGSVSSPTLLADVLMAKLIDPDAGGLAGATGIARCTVTFDAPCSNVLVYWSAVDTGHTNTHTPSGKRELQLCAPWIAKFRSLPAA